MEHPFAMLVAGVFSDSHDWMGDGAMDSSSSSNQVKRAAIYARVSTDGQTTENQVRLLRESAERRGWEVVGVFIDHGISGSKGREDRPAFDQLMKGATRREFDVVMAWAVDRLGRSLQNLGVFLGDIKGAGVDIFLHQQALDTTTPSGRAMFQMLGVFSEFERAMIQERVKAGLDRARAQGKVLGRPKVPAETEQDIKRVRAERGWGIRKIARELGVGVGTVQRVLAVDGHICRAVR